MQLFPKLFSSSRSPEASRGPETQPVKMNLEERMVFRRELLFETLRVSLGIQGIETGTFRLKVMRTDKRGHCFVVMIDVSPAFMDSPRGQHQRLNALAALLIKTALDKYSLMVGGIYWRADDTLDANIASWAKPGGVGAASGAGFATSIQNPLHHEGDPIEPVNEQVLAAFVAARQKSSDQAAEMAQVGGRTYMTDVAPLTLLQDKPSTSTSSSTSC